MGGGGGETSGLAFLCRGALDLLLQDGHNQVVLGHEVVLHHELGKAVAQQRFILVFIKKLAVVEVRVRKDPVNPTTHRAQLGHG